MISINQEIELLERCAQEYVLTSLLATDQHVRRNKHALAAEYHAMIVGLKTFALPNASPGR